MSSEARRRPATTGVPAQVTDRLGYLLKHARERLSELTAAALAPYGLNGRELSVLLVVADGEPGSQQHAARRLGVDRTTMVALLDDLEDKDLVSRHADADDRRRNIVEPTAKGRDVLRRATRASAAAERRFLASLDDEAAGRFREALRELVLGDEASGGR